LSSNILVKSIPVENRRLILNKLSKVKTNSFSLKKLKISFTENPLNQMSDLQYKNVSLSSLGNSLFQKIDDSVN
jgi:hypothetical protein